MLPRWMRIWGWGTHTELLASAHQTILTIWTSPKCPEGFSRYLVGPPHCMLAKSTLLCTVIRLGKTVRLIVVSKCVGTSHHL